MTVRDTTAPVITSVSSSLTAEATSPAGAVVTYADATATDAVGPVTITYSKASGATFALGTTTVSVTATDAYGNHSSKSFTVTVKDTTPPVVTAPNMTVEATQSSGWKVGTFAASASDAVGPVTLTYSKSVGTVLPFGTTTVTVTAKDGAGNTATATFTVLVQDTTPPAITAPDKVVEATSSAGAKATYAPSATDAVGPVTLTVSIPSGTTFALGTTPVTVTATDGHGNVSTATFNVTVQDTTPPALTVSGNVTVEAPSSAGATVSYAAATATDAVGAVTIAYSQASGTVFPLGVTTVVVTATDGAGNTSTKSFTVTVRDTTAPVITSVSSSLTAEATSPAGAVVTYADPTATDAVGPVAFSFSKPSGATFALGTTTVTVTATDAYGNHSSKTFTVTVKDTTAPVITAPDMTVEATQSSGWKVGTFAASASDAVGPVTLTYSKSTGQVLPFGTTTVTVTATDGAGNHASTTFNVLVQDTTAPAITAPDLTVEATSPAGAKVTLSPSATDAVGPVTVTTSIPSGTIFPIGTTTVAVTATDGHGNSSSTSFTVTVQDTTAPAINAPLYLVVEATSLAGAVVTYPSFATDAVGPITYTYSIPSGALYALGFAPSTVTMTATDAYGNTSTASFTVFVHDSTPPVITSASSNIVVEATMPAGAVVSYAPATATDALAPPVITYSANSGSTFGIGTTTVWVTATDIVGNVTKTKFTVTVRDTTPPVITSVSPNLTVEATSSSGANVTYAAATATDAVGPVTFSYSKSSGSKFAIGTTTVTVTAKDAYGNTSTRTFTVTVVDTTPPAITTISANLTVEATSPAGAVVTYAAATATDAVGPVTLSYSKSSGSTYALGTTTVTVTATDGYGNVSTRTFTVTVQDTTPPALTVSGNLTAEATSPAGAAVTYAAATATDKVGPVTIGYSAASGSVFALGTTTVTVTATDGAGNVTTKTFAVTVRDTTPPAITAPNLTVEATSGAGAVVTYAPTATDAVGPVSIGLSRASGSLFALGTATVTVTATDGAGNTATKTFTVTVKDTTPPLITSVSPNIVVEAPGSSGATVSYAAATATDAVSGVTITYSKASGAVFPVGVTTVTVTAKDAAGNASTQTFTVTVQDTTPPVITSVSGNLTVEATSPAGAAVSYAAAKATDAVGPVTITYSKSSGSTFALGTTTVTVTATDGAGNSSTATFAVTVRDTTAPVIVSAPNLTVEATSAAGAAVTFAPTVTDAVGPITLTYSIASGSTFGFGTTTVTVTATDGAGNHSSKTFTVTVRDTTPPAITAPNLTVEATSGSGAAVVFSPTITDAVGPITVTYSRASGSIFGLGTTSVTITAKDGYGNTSTKTFTITVRDTTPPTITSVSPDLIVTTTHWYGAVVTYAAAVAHDTVSGVTITYSKASGSTFAVGTTTVTVTATDAAGNSTTRTFTVTVVKH